MKLSELLNNLIIKITEALRQSIYSISHLNSNNNRIRLRFHLVTAKDLQGLKLMINDHNSDLQFKISNR